MEPSAPICTAAAPAWPSSCPRPAGEPGTGRWRDTALAGIAHALDRLDTIPPQARAGFYTGHVGVAYAAALIGRSLERADLEAQAIAVLERLGGAADDDVVVDLALRGHRGDRSAPGPGRPARPPGVVRSRDAAGSPDRRDGDQERRRLVMAGIGGRDRGRTAVDRAGPRSRGHRLVAARARQRHRLRRDDRSGASGLPVREPVVSSGGGQLAGLPGGGRRRRTVMRGVVPWGAGNRAHPPARGRAGIRRLPRGRGSGDADHPVLARRPRHLDRRRFLALSWPRRARRNSSLRVSRARPARTGGARIGGGSRGRGTVCG